VAWIWVSYLLGGILTFVGKLIQIRVSTKKSWKEVLLEVFFLTQSATTTSFTMIGVYFVIGYWYNNQDVLPIHWSWAFLLGTLTEAIAPAVASRVMGIVLAAFSNSKTMLKKENGDQKEQGG